MSVNCGSSHLFLIRHGESNSNLENRIQGHSDSGLTDRGIRQAQKMAQRLSRTGFDRIYSSDLGRALETSGALAKAHGSEVQHDPLLREIALGEWEGLTTDEVDRDYNLGYQKWLKSPTKMSIPGAESVDEFHNRVRTRLEAILKEHEGSRVAVVTHGGVIASAVSYWLKSDFDTTLLNLRIDNTSVTVVESSASRVKIHSLNDISHLDDEDLSLKNIFTNR